MTNTDAKLIEIANLTQQQSVLGVQIKETAESFDDIVSYDRVLYSLPQKTTFVAMRNNKTKDWVTTDNCRFVFKKGITKELDRSIMLPVGLINLDTKEVVVFNLKDDKQIDNAKSRVVLPFFPGFFIRKDITNNNCPQYSVNAENSYIWFNSAEKTCLSFVHTYELVVPSNLEQIQEVGTPVIGYIPFITGDENNLSKFEFYEAY